MIHVRSLIISHSPDIILNITFLHTMLSITKRSMQNAFITRITLLPCNWPRRNQIFAHHLFNSLYATNNSYFHLCKWNQHGALIKICENCNFWTVKAHFRCMAHYSSGELVIMDNAHPQGVISIEVCNFDCDFFSFYSFIFIWKAIICSSKLSFEISPETGEFQFPANSTKKDMNIFIASINDQIRE